MSDYQRQMTKVTVARVKKRVREIHNLGHLEETISERAIYKQTTVRAVLTFRDVTGIILQVIPRAFHGLRHLGRVFKK